MENVKLHCRKCRRYLMLTCSFLTTHGETLIASTNSLTHPCNDISLWHINYEDAPAWITHNIEKGNWLSGKIDCPECKGRLGSFNFVEPRKCICAAYVTPPVWIIKSRVDVAIKPAERKNDRGSVIDETWTFISNSGETAVPSVSSGGKSSDEDRRPCSTIKSETTSFET